VPKKFVDMDKSKDEFEQDVEDQANFAEEWFDEPINRGWQSEWKEMPYFQQIKDKPYMELVVRLRNDEDRAKFEELMDQPINLGSTKGIWYPRLVHGETAHQRFIDKEDLDDFWAEEE